MTVLAAPWTPEQVASLNGYQHRSGMHPFTCGDDGCRREHGDVLVAFPSGWACPHCPYRQYWAHSWMTDWSWQQPDLWQAGEIASGAHWPGTPRVPWVNVMDPSWSRWLVRVEAARAQEERGRAEWLAGVKERLGLITAGDLAGGRGRWSALEISNCGLRDRTVVLPDGLEDDLRAGLLAHHNGARFTGHLWWDREPGVFREEVFCCLVSQGVWAAPRLATLVCVVNLVFGWD